jgi:IS30 family transposase
MDFGFMRGSGFASKDLEGRTITSIDGYRSYLLIICRKSRYLWVFLTKTKQPPLSIVTRFLQENGNPLAKKPTIRTDEGGELWGSEEFRSIINEAGYLLEPTAANAPFQNGMAERPNRTLCTVYYKAQIWDQNIGRLRYNTPYISKTIYHTG